MNNSINSHFVQKTINCRGKIIDLSSPIVMGIINLTPDSFYDGGRWNDFNVLQQAEKMLSEGAKILDIGGMSSRPGSDFVSETEEINRIINPIKSLVKEFPEAILSVDSWRSKVIKVASDCGIHIVNDISAGNLDKELLETVASLKLPYILMHMKGIPKNMQNDVDSSESVNDIIDFFTKKLDIIKSVGIKDVILDPGFGFGKTLKQNYEILMRLREFDFLGLPIMVGISRKSMIYNLLNINSEDSLNGTTALNVLSLEKAAKILRVHDVKEAVQTIKILNFCKNLG